MAASRAPEIDRATDAEAALLAAQVDGALGTDALRFWRCAAWPRWRARRTTLPTRCSTRSRRWRARSTRSSRWRCASAGRARRRGRGARRGRRGRGTRRGRGGGAARVRRRSRRRRRRAQRGPGGGAIGCARRGARALRPARALGAEPRRRSGRASPRRSRAAQGDATRDEAIAAALRRARELDPGEARYRAELALRTTQSRRAPRRTTTRSYLVPSQTILARRQGVRAPPPVVAENDVHPGGVDPGGDASKAVRVATDATATSKAPDTEAPDVADRELHWLRAVVMHPDRRVSELVHYAREIVIAPRTEDELYEDDPRRGRRRPRSCARACTARTAATAFPVEEASDNARPRIRWPELAPGRRRRGRVPLVDREAPSAAAATRRSSASTTRAPCRRTRSLYNEVDRRVARRTGRSTSTSSTARPTAATRRTKAGATSSASSGTTRPTCPTSRSRRRSARVIPTVVLSTFKDWTAFRALVRRGGARLHRARRAGARARREADAGQGDARREARARSSTSSPTTSAT